MAATGSHGEGGTLGRIVGERGNPGATLDAATTARQERALTINSCTV